MKKNIYNYILIFTLFLIILFGCNLIKEEDYPKLVYLKIQELDFHVALNEKQIQLVKGIFIKEVKLSILDRDKYNDDFYVLGVMAEKRKIETEEKIEKILNNEQAGQYTNVKGKWKEVNKTTLTLNVILALIDDQTIRMHGIISRGMERSANKFKLDNREGKIMPVTLTEIKRDLTDYQRAVLDEIKGDYLID